MTISLLTPPRELRDRARKTSPIPPAPRFASRRYLPKMRLPGGPEDNFTAGFPSWSCAVLLIRPLHPSANSLRYQYMLPAEPPAVEPSGRDRGDNVGLNATPPRRRCLLLRSEIT